MSPSIDVNLERNVVCKLEEKYAEDIDTLLKAISILQSLIAMCYKYHTVNELMTDIENAL